MNVEKVAGTGSDELRYRSEVSDRTGEQKMWVPAILIHRATFTTGFDIACRVS